MSRKKRTFLSRRVDKGRQYESLRAGQVLHLDGAGGDSGDSEADVYMILYRLIGCLLYTSPSPRDYAASRMPSSA